MKKILLSIAVIATAATGCKKDNDDYVPPASRRNMLLGKWTLTENGNDINNNGIVDAGETQPSSVSGMSGTAQLNNDGTGNITASAFGFPYSISGNWELINNENTIKLGNANDTFYLEIKGISDSLLTIRDTTIFPTGAASWFIFKK